MPNKQGARECVRCARWFYGGEVEPCPYCGPSLTEPSEPKEDKSEGELPFSVIVPVDPSPLPVDEEFIIYRDEDDDYVIRAQRGEQNEHLAAHGADPNEAIWNIRQVLDMAHQLKSQAALKEAQNGK